MNEVKRAVIVSAVRTPMGSFNGMFSQVPATKLGSLAIAEALKRVHVQPDRVDQVYMGCVLSAGLGQAPARQASIEAGIPHSIGAATVNKVCGSSIQTVIMATQAIVLGETNMMSYPDARQLPRGKRQVNLFHATLTSKELKSFE